jgi:hypothetical protein
VQLAKCATATGSIFIRECGINEEITIRHLPEDVRWTLLAVRHSAAANSVRPIGYTLNRDKRCMSRFGVSQVRHGTSAALRLGIVPEIDHAHQDYGNEFRNLTGEDCGQ